MNVGKKFTTPKMSNNSKCQSVRMFKYVPHASAPKMAMTAPQWTLRAAA